MSFGNDFKAESEVIEPSGHTAIQVNSANRFGVVGHGEVFRRFETTLSRNRLASTYLFVGPNGIGKRTTALALAKPMLCTETGFGKLGAEETSQSGSQLDACGQCDSCRLADRGTHPDVFSISKPTGKSSLPLSLFLGEPDQRNRSGLCHDISLKPMIGSRRIAIIDDADDFSVESANCLLKTLEEPPPGAVIFLIGTSLSKQLPTIRSRAQVVRFTALKDEEVSKVLASLPMEEPDTVIGETEATELARRALGSVTQALAYRDAGLRESQEVVEKALNSNPIDPLQLSTILEEHTKSAGTEPSLRRTRFRKLIHTMIGFYRQQMLSSSHSVTVAREQALAALDACFEAEASLGRNANQSALVQHLATQLWRIQTGRK